jgi:hypothetical protein
MKSNNECRLIVMIGFERLIFLSQNFIPELNKGVGLCGRTCIGWQLAGFPELLGM